MLAIAILTQMAAVVSTGQVGVSFPPRKPDYERLAYDASLNEFAVENLIRTIHVRRTNVIDVLQKAGPYYSVVTIRYRRSKNPKRIDEMTFTRIDDGRYFIQITM